MLAVRRTNWRGWGQSGSLGQGNKVYGLDSGDLYLTWGEENFVRTHETTESLVLYMAWENASMRFNSEWESPDTPAASKRSLPLLDLQTPCTTQDTVLSTTKVIHKCQIWLPQLGENILLIGIDIRCFWLDLRVLALFPERKRNLQCSHIGKIENSQNSLKIPQMRGDLYWAQNT